MYPNDEDYRYRDGFLRRRDGTKIPLPRIQYLQMRYIERLSHYSIWVRQEWSLKQGGE